MINKHAELDFAFIEIDESYQNKECDNVRFPNDDILDGLSSEVRTYMLSKTEIENLLQKV